MYDYLFDRPAQPKLWQLLYEIFRVSGPLLFYCKHIKTNIRLWLKKVLDREKVKSRRNMLTIDSIDIFVKIIEDYRKNLGYHKGVSISV